MLLLVQGHCDSSLSTKCFRIFFSKTLLSNEIDDTPHSSFHFFPHHKWSNNITLLSDKEEFTSDQIENVPCHPHATLTPVQKTQTSLTLPFSLYPSPLNNFSANSKSWWKHTTCCIITYLYVLLYHRLSFWSSAALRFNHLQNKGTISLPRWFLISLQLYFFMDSQWLVAELMNFVFQAWADIVTNDPNLGTNKVLLPVSWELKCCILWSRMEMWELVV